MGGWYDVFIGGTVQSYAMMRRNGGSAEARAGQRLLIGPWSHADGTDLGTFPDRSFGLEGSIKAADITAAHLRFCDRWVRGRTDTPYDAHPVRIFVMGIDQWRDEADWPLPDTRYTDFFLAGGGRANTASGDGLLTRDGASVDAVDTFLYDPRRPVPTVGGTVLAAVPGTYPGPADQAAIETREDVLCFTTAVLERPVEVTGHVTLVRTSPPRHRTPTSPASSSTCTPAARRSCCARACSAPATAGRSPNRSSWSRGRSTS